MHHDVTKGFADKIKAKALSVNFKKAHFPLGNDDQAFQKRDYNNWRSPTPIESRSGNVSGSKIGMNQKGQSNLQIGHMNLMND